MLTQAQESGLTSGGDCVDHWHSTDRILQHDDILEFQQLTKAIAVTSNKTVDDRWDYLLVNTDTGNITITLPPAINGREIEVMKNATPNYVSIVPTGTDRILGSTEIRVFNYGTSLRFKAITGGWFII